jgi:hypothetical protein
MLLGLIYVLTICYVGAVLFVSVNKFEPNRRLALLLKFLILAVGAAAIARQLLP